MSRYIKNTVILLAIEAVIGTDQVPSGATNAMLVSDMTIDPVDAQLIARNNIIGYFGSQGSLVGAISKKLSFSVELAGSGTAGTAPAWGAALQACAMAEGVLATPARVEYTPVSTSLKTATIYYYDDGVLHKLLGAMGNVSITAKIGEKPKLKFDFIGLDGGDTAAANATPTLTAWKPPVAMRKSNVTDITLGCTYATGALSGGTAYSSTGLELMLGNAVNFNPLLGTETVDITDRDVTGKVELDLTAAQEVSLTANLKAMTTQSLGFTIGTTTGNKIILHSPVVQLTKTSKVDRQGKRLIGYDLSLQPSSGNDELRLAQV